MYFFLFFLFVILKWRFFLFLFITKIFGQSKPFKFSYIHTTSFDLLVKKKRHFHFSMNLFLCTDFNTSFNSLCFSGHRWTKWCWKKYLFENVAQESWPCKKNNCFTNSNFMTNAYLKFDLKDWMKNNPCNIFPLLKNILQYLSENLFHQKGFFMLFLYYLF